jgi:hypothetical protein
VGSGRPAPPQLSRKWALPCKLVNTPVAIGPLVIFAEMAELAPDNEYETLLEQVRTALAAAVTIDTKGVQSELLFKSTLVSGLDFAPPLRRVMKCVPLCQYLAKYADHLDGLPRRSRAELHDSAQGCVNAIQTMRDYKVPPPGVHEQPTTFDRNIAPLEKRAQSWAGPLLLAIAYVNRGSTRAEDVLQRLATAESQVQNQLAEINAMAAETRVALDAAKNAALVSGVAAQGQEFRTAKDAYGKEAKYWAFGAAACAGSNSRFCSRLYPLGGRPPAAGGKLDGSGESESLRSSPLAGVRRLVFHGRLRPKLPGFQAQRSHERAPRARARDIPTVSRGLRGEGSPGGDAACGRGRLLRSAERIHRQ